jgi:hypothetical protein
MIKLDEEAPDIIYIFSKYGIERNGAYHEKYLVYNFISEIKEKEANILLNSD